LQTSVTPIYGACPVTGEKIQIIGIDFSKDERIPLALLALRITADGELLPVRIPYAYEVPDTGDKVQSSQEGNT
jgi:hypothetical protein